MDIINKSIMAGTVFTANDIPLNQVNEFKYLGRILEKSDCDSPAINRNIKQARIAWSRLGKILTKERTNMKAMASVYRAVVQAVLLYGSESWVTTIAMEKS
jgi:hypothetical protein